ncbi:alpha/beta hydrolase [Limosilactobacillus sp.]|uniref:alpha/beta hydrolase n=1 Tax=Limosilactobacillus sp. TaxID=2773925 RepID=UPI00345E47B1
MLLRKFRFLLLALVAVVSVSLSLTIPVHASSNTATVFVHGLQGSHNSTDTMISDLSQRYPGTKRVMTINVQEDGSLQVSGHYRNVKHPLVQVNFLNNSAPTTTNAQWLGKAMKYLKTKAGVSKINFVAHSAGNVAVYQLLTSHPQSIPDVQKFVILAGPFDGVLSLNDQANKVKVNANDHYKPSVEYPANSYYPSYQQLVKMSSAFPKNIKVLNIYGNVGDGSNSDTLVSNASALSVNYLLKGQKSSVQNRCYRSAKATHSGLHRSKTVDNWIANFLWK